MSIRKVFTLILGMLLAFAANAEKIIPAAERTADYLPLLKGKKVALLINQTSRVGDKLLVDVLLEHKVQVVKIFVPEHGFRGTESAGVLIGNETDQSTGLPLISLYGKHKKPTPDDLKDVDLVIYDIQDVGARFYTYIATLQYM